MGVLVQTHGLFHLINNYNKILNQKISIIVEYTSIILAFSIQLLF